MKTILNGNRILSRRVALGALPLLVLLSGCVASIGNRQPAGRTQTLGQELIDLQKARDAGSISPPEYEVQRAKLLGNPPPSARIRTAATDY